MSPTSQKGLGDTNSSFRERGLGVYFKWRLLFYILSDVIQKELIYSKTSVKRLL